MDQHFFCQVNLWIDDADLLEKWLFSFADDEDFLRSCLYVNLLDSVADEKTAALCETFCAKYPQNSAVNACKNRSYAASYNSVREESANFDYVNYTTLAARLKASDLKKMRSAIGKKKNVGAWSFYPISLQPDGKHKPYLPYRAATYTQSIGKFNRFSTYLPGYLIRSDLPLNGGFDESAPEDADILFLMLAIADGKDYILTPLPLICDEFFENDYYNYRRQYNPDWYTRTLREVYLPCLQERGRSRFIKAMVMHQIAVRFACNRNDRCKNLLQGEELDAFLDAVREVLLLIDNSTIVTYNRNEMKMLPKFMGLVFLRLKYQNEALLPTIADNGTGNYVAVYKNALVDNKATLKAAITCMDYDENAKELVIDGKLTNVYVFNYEKLKCYVHYGKKKKAATPTDVYSLEKFFGIAVFKDFTYQVRLSRSELSKTKTVSFSYQYGAFCSFLPLTFPRMESRLTESFPNSYWQFSKFIMTYNAKKSILQLSGRSTSRALKREMKLCRDFVKRTPKADRSRAYKSILLRMAYLATKPLYRKKQIWLTFDQLFKGGDNGEYFFRHVSDHHSDKVKMYYIANKDCADYQRLKKTYGHLLPFNSWRAKLMALHADCVFATRVDVKQYCGFGPQLEKYFRNLLHYDVFCLQHGLTIQRIAQYQNRLFDDTKLYFCVSPNEVQNLLHPVYGYRSEDLILTGAPRYDGLVNRDQKQILIAPTWRRNVTAGTNKKGHMHEYSVNFKETEYFRIYNGLINNKKLIECAKETGYRIIYLVHPILSPQVGDFSGPEQVTILAGAKGDVSYEKLMCESSLMLTDHSGIQFDFAYMRKPLIYYHPDTLPPQYDAGGMDYDTQAFGPVCRNEQEVVDAMCRAMRRSCKMEEEYRRRVEAFFAFDDRNNCERVFIAAAKHQGLIPTE